MPLLVPLSLSMNDLMIIKECLNFKWEYHRPEGDEKNLHARIVDLIKHFDHYLPHP